MESLFDAAVRDTIGVSKETGSPWAQRRAAQVLRHYPVHGAKNWPEGDDPFEDGHTRRVRSHSGSLSLTTYAASIWTGRKHARKPQQP